MLKTLFLELLVVFLVFLNAPFVAAQVKISAKVESNVDLQKSFLFVSDGGLTVEIKDKDGNRLASKRVELGEKEVLTDSFGRAKLSAALDCGTAKEIDALVVDRVNNFGLFSLCRKKGLLSKIFAKADASAKALTLTPATVSLKIPAGETTTQELIIANSTGEDQTFEVYLSDYLSSDSGAVIKYTKAGSQQDSLAGMISISPVKFDLKNGDSKKVKIRIAPGNDVKKGRYKGAIVFSPLIFPKNSSQSRLTVNQKVASLIGVEVGGNGSAVSGAGRIFSRLPAGGDSKFYGELSIFAIIVLGALLRYFALKRKNQKYKVKQERK